MVTHGAVLLQEFSAADPHFHPDGRSTVSVFEIFGGRMLPLYEAIGRKNPCGSGLAATQEVEELFLISSLPGPTETTLLLPTRRRLRATVEAILRSFVLDPIVTAVPIGKEEAQRRTAHLHLLVGRVSGPHPHGSKSKQVAQSEPACHSQRESLSNPTSHSHGLFKTSRWTIRT